MARSRDCRPWDSNLGRGKGPVSVAAERAGRDRRAAKSEQARLRSPTMLVTLLVPLLNEEAVLPQLIERLRAVAPKLVAEVEFLFVDDGSTDATPERLAAFAREEPRLRVLRLARNFGQQMA